MKFMYDPNWIVFPTNEKKAINKYYKNLHVSESLYDCKSYGILCGPRSRIAVVDVDTIDGSELFRRDLNTLGYNYLEVITKRGSHFYFEQFDYSTKILKGNYNHDKYGRLDIINNNDGYVIGPGSIIKNHCYWIKRYTINTDNFSSVVKLLKTNNNKLEQYYDPSYD